MAGLVESFIFKMVVDNQQFNRGLKESAATAKQVGDELEKVDKGLLSKTSSAFLGVAAVQGSLNFLKDAVKASGELANAQATVNQMFGESASIINEAAQASVKNFGLSERAALQAATSIASLGKAAGLQGDNLALFSTDLLKIGTDLAAFYNTTVDEAVRALQSGLSGTSTEPMRRFGVVINDTALKAEYLRLTGEKVNDTLTQQQRTVAFMSLLQQQAAVTTGQWTREYDGWLATSQRFGATLEDFKAGVGQNFIGPVTTAVDTLSTAIGWFSSFDEATQGLGSTMVMAGAALGILVPVLGSLVPKLKAFYAAVKAGESGLGKNVAMFAATVAALKIYDSAITSSEEKTKAVNDAFEAMATGAKSVMQALDDMNKAAEPGIFANFTNFVTGNEQALDDLNVTADELKQRFQDLAEQSPKTAAAVYDVGTRSESGRAAWAKYGVTVAELKGILDEQVRKQKEAQDAQRDWTAVLADSTGMVERNEKAWADYNKELDALDKKADEAKKSIKDLLDEAGKEFTMDFDPIIARQQLVVAMAELDALTTEKVKPEEQAKRALDITEKQRDIRQSILDIIDADIAAQEDANGKALEGADLYQARLDAIAALKVTNPELAGQLDALLAEIQQQKPGIDVALNVLDEDAFRAKVREAIDKVQGGDRSLAIDILIDKGMTEQAANNVISALPDEKIVKIIADAAEAKKNLGLTDEGFLDITARALTDEAQRQLDDLTGSDYIAKIMAQPQLVQAQSDLDQFRRDQAAEAIRIPVVIETSPSSPTSQGGQTVPGGRAAQAGQPITINNYLPSAARPEEVVSALQTWARRNGTAVVVN